MDLPEVRIHLAQYLDKSQLASAVAVDKSWNATFIPFLYSHIFLDNSNKTNSPSLSVVEANADAVRSLHIKEIPSEDVLQLMFTQLKELHISASHWGDLLCHRLSHLILQNPGLLSIQVNVGEFSNSQQLMAALSGCPNLKILSLACLSMSHQDTETLFQICPRLEEMDFSYINAPEKWSVSDGEKLPSMRTLRFGTTGGLPLPHQIAFIQECPGLKSLTWSIEEDIAFPTAELCKILSTTCTELTELHFEEKVVPALPDKELAQIFDSWAKPTHFSIYDTMFGPCAFQSLRRHFSNLSRLDLGTSPNMTSPMIQEIMMSCPRLTALTATHLEARDILGISDEEGKSANLNGSRWTCLNLKDLRLHICCLEDNPEWQRLVLTQLAKLKKLEWLNIAHCSEWGAIFRDGLDLRLEAGLDILGSLKQLQTLTFVGLMQKMEEQDVRWMIQAWPQLESVYGKAHFNKAQRLQLETIFQEGDVQLFDFGNSED
ncbi:hypothetical protein BGX27_008367 [Mortierella sp. AM989]|nr:hypothetical protein BGX27_008367 [Mortierella sp. AM989]